MNQKKSYNAKFEFFTKPLGPGHYEPSIELTKKVRQGPSWGSAPRYKSNVTSPPGPGEYHYFNDTIGLR